MEERLKVFADDKITNGSENLKFLLGSVENVGYEKSVCMVKSSYTCKQYQPM